MWQSKEIILRSSASLQHPCVARLTSKKNADDGNASTVIFNSKNQFRIQTFLVIIDLFIGDLQKRIAAYANVDSSFNFLNYIETNAEGIESSLQKAFEMYPSDISADLKEE